MKFSKDDLIKYRLDRAFETYEDFIIHDQKTIKPLFPKVEIFLSTLKNLIETDES